MKFLIVIILLFVAAAFYFLFVKQKAIDPKIDEAPKTGKELENKIPTKEDFDSILIQNGLKACYNYDALVTESQMMMPSKKAILTAFDEGVKSLFFINDQNKNLDNLVSGIIESPEDFGLEKNPSQDMIKDAIAKGLRDDSKLKIALVPSTIKSDSEIFPPENGEKVDDYWIWHLSAPGYFPGPIWILVKRDGIIPAYHYGYM